MLLTALGAGLTGSCGGQTYENAAPEQFSGLLNSAGIQLIDVRTAQEFAESHLEGAINLDIQQAGFLRQAAGRIDKERPVAVYCRSGRRSAQAAGQLAKEGYQVTNLTGGIVAWQQQGQPVTADTTEIDVFRTPGGKIVRIYALMHASIRIVFDGREITVDPVGRLGERSIDYTAFPKSDYIFVTHEHHDHFDQAALATLSDDRTLLVTNRRCADQLGHGQVMVNGDRLTLSDDLTVEAVPAYNITEGRTQFHPRGRDNGYVLTLDGLRIYFAGDTEDIPEMEEIKDIDIAFLPCNQPYTMTAGQIEKAARTVRPKVLFPYHYSQTDVSRLPAALRSDGIDVRIRHYE